MTHRNNSTLSQLSGGEQQRVAIAIALANNPKLLLADEPTGAVDSKTASYILDIFRELNTSLGLTIVIVTHDRQLSKKVNRVVAIRDGRTSSEFIRKKSYADELAEIAAGMQLEAEESQEELVILDKTGRIQLPKTYLETMGFNKMLKVEIEDDRIILRHPDNLKNPEVG